MDSFNFSLLKQKHIHEDRCEVSASGLEDLVSYALHVHRCYEELKEERDALRAELETLYLQEPIMENTEEGWLFNRTYKIGTKLYTKPVPAQNQKPCGYMHKDAGITTIFNASKCYGDFSEHIPVYASPVPAQLNYDYSFCSTPEENVILMPARKVPPCTE